MGRGAGWATVHGISKSQTQLSNNISFGEMSIQVFPCFIRLSKLIFYMFSITGYATNTNSFLFLQIVSSFLSPDLCTCGSLCLQCLLILHPANSFSLRLCTTVYYQRSSLTILSHASPPPNIIYYLLVQCYFYVALARPHENSDQSPAPWCCVIPCRLAYPNPTKPVM